MADTGKKKLVITEEHFQRVTQALVMRLRQHEESVTKDGIDTGFYTTFPFVLLTYSLFCILTLAISNCRRSIVISA